MSIRTILEFNHDRIADWDFQDFLRIKRMCYEYPDTRHMPHVEGVKILARRHHSDTITVEVKG